MWQISFTAAWCFLSCLLVAQPSMALSGPTYLYWGEHLREKPRPHMQRGFSTRTPIGSPRMLLRASVEVFAMDNAYSGAADGINLPPLSILCGGYERGRVPVTAGVGGRQDPV
jgi:hypothetical protein